MTLSELAGSEPTVIPETEIVLRLVLASAAGAVLGFERELRERSAGLRTHMLTSLAAAVFTILTYEIFHQLRVAGNSNLDPIRVIEAVTAGVSFLAAGTIIHASGEIRGLTTGAGIWLAGALGLACGAGFYIIALFGGILGVAIVVAVKRFEQHLLETKETPAEKKRGKSDGD